MGRNKSDRTEKITFRVRPELKQALDRMFQGFSYSDGFEHLIMAYTNYRKAYWRDIVEVGEKGLNEYGQGMLTDRLNTQLKRDKEHLKHWEELQKIAFPNGSVREEKDNIEEHFSNKWD